MIAQYIDSDDKIDLVRIPELSGNAVSCSVESIPVSSSSHDSSYRSKCRSRERDWSKTVVRCVGDTLDPRKSTVIRILENAQHLFSE